MKQYNDSITATLTSSHRTDLGARFSARHIVNIENKFSQDREQFGNIVPLVTVLFQESFVEVVESVKARRGAGALGLECELGHGEGARAPCRLTRYCRSRATQQHDA